MAKRRRFVVPAAVMPLAKPRWQAKSRVKTADWRPPLLELPAKFRAKVNLVVTAAGWRPPVLGLQATEIPRVRARAHQCLRDPGPFAFFREISDDQKCNRAARCGDCPISARYRRRCSRRGLVDYGNRRSRLLRKRARPARTFPIAGADKCPSPLHRLQD